MPTVDEMITKVVRKFGHENNYTIWFCGLADDPSFSYDSLVNAYISLMALSLALEDEDE